MALKIDQIIKNATKNTKYSREKDDVGYSPYGRKAAAQNIIFPVAQKTATAAEQAAVVPTVQSGKDTFIPYASRAGTPALTQPKTIQQRTLERGWQTRPYWQPWEENEYNGLTAVKEKIGNDQEVAYTNALEALRRNNDLTPEQYQQQLKELQSNDFMQKNREELAALERAKEAAHQRDAVAEFEGVKTLPDFQMFSEAAKGNTKTQQEYHRMYGNSAETAKNVTIDNPVYYEWLNREQIVDGEKEKSSALDIPYMTEDEINVYNYYFGKYGKERADQYLQALEPILYERSYQESLRILHEEMPGYAKAIIPVVGDMVAPFAYIENGINAAIGNNTDKNRGAAALTRYGSEAQQEVLKDAGPVGRFLGNTLYSIVNMGTKLPLGPVGSLAYMTASAAGHGTVDALEKGADPKTALAYGTVIGAIELATEKLPLENLFKIARSGGKQTVRQAIDSILMQSGMEGTEELVSEYADTIFDIAMFGDNSDYMQYKNSLIESGTSEKEAERLANIKFFVENPFASAAGGALSGAFFGGSAEAVNALRARGLSNAEARDDIQPVIPSAPTQAEQTVAPVTPAAAPAQTRTAILPEGHTVQVDQNNELVQNGFDHYNTYVPLTDADLDGYLKTGKYSSIKHDKARIIERGESPILRSKEEVINFIDNSIDREERNVIKAYGKVKDKFAQDIFAASKGTIDIRGNYFELLSDDLWHAYREHHKPKQEGDIPLSRDDFRNIVPYIDAYDDIIFAEKRSDQSVAIQLGKKINGYSIITEIVSRKRGAVRVKDMWGVTTEKYLRKYKKGSKSAGHQSMDRQTSSTPVPVRQNTLASATIVPASQQNVNSEQQAIIPGLTNTSSERNAPTPSAPQNRVVMPGIEQAANSSQAEESAAPVLAQTEDRGRTVTWTEAQKDAVSQPANAFEEKWGVRTKVAQPDIQTDASAFLQDGTVVLNADKIETFAGAVSKIAHEATHIAENSQHWSAIKRAAAEYYKAVDPDLKPNVMREAIKERYRGLNLTDEQAAQEMVAGFMEDVCSLNSYTAERAAQILLERSPNTFRRIMQYLREKVAYLKVLKGLNKQRRQELRAARASLDNLQRALNEYRKGETATKNGTQFSTKSSYGEGSFTDYYLQYLGKKYGTIPKGESPFRDVSVPRKTSDRSNVQRGVRTILEAEGTPDAMIKPLQEAIAKDVFAYQVIHDAAAQKSADKDIETRGFRGAMEKWNAAVNGDGVLGKNELVLGETLMLEAGKAGDFQTFQKLAAEISAEATRAGQTVQAMRLIKRMTPEGRLYYVQKSVDTMQKELNKRLKSKAPDLEINPELGKKLLEAKTPQEIDAVADEILKDVAQQVPATWVDKWNAWRYMAMLFNPRTHIRNILGNAVFMPARGLQKAIIHVLEHARVGDHYLVKPEGRTVSFASKLNKADRPLFDLANEDFREAKDTVLSSGKLNPTSRINEMRTIFKSRALEGVRKFNNKALDAEDMLFKKQAYVAAFAQAAKARGLTAEFLKSSEGAKQLNSIQEHAAREALEATYQDASKAATALNELKNKNVAFNILGNSLFPFTKTPINILKRGVEYSPIGLLKGITDMTYGVHSGKVTASDAVRNLSKGLSGTGITLLGAWLSSMGLLVAGVKDDKKEQNFETLQGAKTYALHIGDTYYTIDWMAPVALPLFVGAELQQSMEGDGFDFGNLADSLTKVSEPMFNLSMLDGINSTFKGIAYSNGNYLTDFMVDAAVGYITQGLPTLGGQIARTIDGTTRNSYYTESKEISAIPVSVQRFLRQAQAKIPGLSYLLDPKVDQWGRNTGKDDVVIRAFENFISPGYISTRNETPVDKEIAKVYKDTGSSGILPKYADKSFNVDKEKYHLTSKEYAQYSTERGRRSYDYINELIGMDDYQKLSNDQKAAAISWMYEIANAEARHEVNNDCDIPTEYAKAIEAEQKAGILYGQYRLYKLKLDSSPNQAEVEAALNSMDLTKSQKAFLWDQKWPKAKYKPFA